MSTRPTVMSNSWGTPASIIGMSNCKLQQRAGLAGTTIATNPFAFVNYSDIDYPLEAGTTQAWAPYNAYTDQIVAEGAHFLTAAGNDNHLLEYARSYPLSAHPAFVLFKYNDGAGTVFDRLAPYTVTDGATQGTDNTFTSGSNYPLMRPIGGGAALNVTYENNGGLGIPMFAGLYTSVTGSATDPLKMTCKSPASSYGSYLAGAISPCIVVGDVTPVGPFMTLNEAYVAAFSAANAAYCYNGLSALNTANGLPITPNCRYTSLSGAEYVKTNYSCFGPLVDVYACGNATWAAYSNQAPAGATPVNTITSTERYKFFNGTSAATPVAAGCLATYLAAHPTATPTQAKMWLMNNAVSGSILETEYHTVPLRVKTINLITGTAGPIITMNYDCPYSMVEMTTNATSLLNTWWNTCGQTYNTFLGLGRYESLSVSNKILSLRTAHQFYRSNNLVVQAYPLRKMVLETDSLVHINDVTKTAFSFLSSNFDTFVPVPWKKTHKHSESLIV